MAGFLQEGRFVSKVTPLDGQQMLNAALRHNKFTAVGLDYRRVQNVSHSTDVYKENLFPSSTQCFCIIAASPAATERTGRCRLLHYQAIVPSKTIRKTAVIHSIKTASDVTVKRILNLRNVVQQHTSHISAVKIFLPTAV